MKKTNAIRLLQQQKIEFDTIEYTYAEGDLSIEQIAIDNQLNITKIYKTLVVKGNNTGVVVAVVAGNESLSLKKLSKLSGNKKMAMVPVKELQQLTGYIRGGCSPVGMKKAFAVYISDQAQKLDWVYVNAGLRGLLFGCTPQDLLKVSNGQWADI
ncbi:MAG: Cys-tRNA(Pro) deacylase [Aureispira sp.]|nr:Cys-tRNA(Pro) deacylase [Aureispira sp.]